MVLSRGGVGNDGRRSSKEDQQRLLCQNEAWAMKVEAVARRRSDNGGGCRKETQQ